MPVLRRLIRSCSLDGITFLGAVEGPNGVMAWPTAGQRAATVRAALGARLISLDGTRASFRATLKPGSIHSAAPEEQTLLAGRNVLVGVRNGERPEAIADWLSFHAFEHGADAALLFDRSEPGSDDVAKALTPDLPLVLVQADQPTGAPDASDLRAPETAPGARKTTTPPVNAWHSAFAQHGIYDLLRHRFLAAARAVAFANPGDLILRQPDGMSVFDHAASQPDMVVQLRGTETYPWRLRQGHPAPHADHVAERRGERRRLLSWAIAPTARASDEFWRPFPPYGLTPAKTAPVPFIRAMGVVYPAAPVNQLVRKAELVERPELVAAMTRHFNVEPIRLPPPSEIPARPGTNRLTIVTAMKNEGPFILDWVAHNRAIGVSDILAYTNDCEDGTDRLLGLLAKAGVHHRENPYRETGKVPQYAAFRAADIDPVVREADWLATLDVDEYLNIHAGDGSLTSLLDAMPEAHVISIPWRMFGNADIHGFTDTPVVQQFTRCAPEFAPRPLQAWAFKTLYRNAGLFRRLGVHRPKGLVRDVRDRLVWMDATGQPLPPATWDKAWRMSKAQWGYTHATLNHYSVRSAESFLIKRERGKVNRTARAQDLAYWFRMNHNMVEDHSVLRLTEKVAAEKAKLLALPGVQEAHASAVAWHQARIRDLRADRDYAAFFDKITSPRMQHLSRIATNFGANVHLVGPEVIPDDIAASDPDTPFYWTVKLTAS